MTEKHDTETAREALSRLVDAAYGRGQRTCFSIPPNEKRDADLILEAIITERDALRADHAATARVVAAHERIALAVAEWLDADDCRARLDMPPRPIDQSDDERQDAEDRVRTAREDVRAALAALDARDGAR